MATTSIRALFQNSKPHPLQHLAENHYAPLKSASLSDFQLCSSELDQLYQMQKLCFAYIGIKNTLMNDESQNKKIISLQTFLMEAQKVSCSKALYTYLNVLDQNADNKDTIADVLSLLYDEFKLGSEIQHLVVTGDAKTYTHLQAIKCESGSSMSCLIPFIGDWHVL